jgi:hypothetical protein
MAARRGRSSVCVSAAIAGALGLAAPLSAQGVPGAPKGDWLAYSITPLPSSNLQRCGVSAALFAEWRKILDAAAAIVSTSPGLADLTGYVPELKTGADYAGPAGNTDCRKDLLAGYVALWPWTRDDVEPNPAAATGGPKFRLKQIWVNNTRGVLSGVSSSSSRSGSARSADSPCTRTGYTSPARTTRRCSGR